MSNRQFDGSSPETEFRDSLYSIARLAAQEYQPSKEFLALHDYKSCAEHADEIFKNIIHELATLSLATNNRELFLSVRRRRDPAA